MNAFERSRRYLFFFALFIFVGQFCAKQTDGFSIKAISSNRPYNEAYETRPLSEEEVSELNDALSQPYSYYGCGGQAYAFFSEDGKYVIKFFKQRLFNPSKLPFRKKKNLKRADKLERDFFSYHVAFDQLQEITELLFTHLNTTTDLGKKLTLYDPIGVKHTLDLDKYDFILQRRAERIYDRVERLMRGGDIQGAKKTLKEALKLISVRAQLGYRDRDPDLKTNCGFIGDKAIKIDVGRFVEDPKMKTKGEHNEELLKIAAPLEKWIEENHPEILSSYLESVCETLL